MANVHVGVSRTRIRASVYDDVVEDFVRSVGFVRVVVLGLFAYQLFDQISVLAFGLRSHNRALES